MGKKVAVVAGGTGLVGKELTTMLLSDDYYDQIKILSRKAHDFNDPRVEEIILDFNKLEDHAKQVSGTDYFCLLGTTMKKAGSKEAFKLVDYEYPLKFARLAAKDPDFEHFLIVTSMGANADSVLFYNQIKGAVENSLKEMSLKSLHILQPSLLLGKREEFRLWEEIGKFFTPLMSFFLIGPNKKFRSIQASEVAQAMLEIAKQDNPGSHVYHSNQIHKIAYDATHRKVANPA